MLSEKSGLADLRSLDINKLNSVERELLALAAQKKGLGLNFSKGRLYIKPRTDNYLVSFLHNGKKVFINYNGGSVFKINGLAENTIDYINLCGYNKDVYIEAYG